MNSFTIFPHKGYINTDFFFYSETVLDVIDLTTNETYELNKGLQIHRRLSVGIHKFCVSGNENDVDFVMVENAYRFGGSALKSFYCFENSPWVLAVMKDRIYFSNTETKKEFVENGITPDSVNCISADYLLFSSDEGKINSIFDLTVNKEICKFEKLIYKSSECVVFSDFIDEIECIHCLYFENGSIVEEQNSCSDYSLDLNNLYLFIKDINGGFIIRNLKERIMTSVTCDEAKCFVPNSRFVVAIKNRINTEIQIWDLIQNKSYSSKSYRDDISVINGNDEYDIKKANAVFDEAIKLIAPYSRSMSLKNESCTLDYLCWNDNVYCLCLKTFVETNSSGRKDVKFISTFSEAKTYEEILRIDGKLTVDDIIINIKTCVIKHTDTMYVVTDDKKVKAYKDMNFYMDSDGLPYFIKIENGITYIYVESLEEIYHTSDKLDFNFFEKYSCIYNEDKHVYFTLANPHANDGFSVISVRQLNNIIFFTAKDTGAFIINKKIVIARQCPPITGLSASESGRQLIGYNEGRVEYYRWNSVALLYELRSELWEDLFNHTAYNDAWFDDHNECILYDKNSKTYKYYDSINDKTEDFADTNFVVKNQWFGINGYKPIVSYDNARRPVFKDPISLNSINPAYLKDYAFISPDGKFIADNCVHSKYVNDITKEEITDEQHRQLCFSLDWHPIKGLTKKEDIPEKKYQLRKKFVYDNIEYFRNSNKLKEKGLIYNRLEGINDGELDKIIKTYEVFVCIFISEKYFISYKDVRENKEYEIKLAKHLGFLNYISFSYDSKFLAIGGKYPFLGGGGLYQIYDLNTHESLYSKTTNRAVWLTAFNRKDMMAFYTSDPLTTICMLNDKAILSLKDSNEKTSPLITLSNRSFLTFSPSGKYFALSRQGYIPYSADNPNWGHQPSCDIYIHSCENPQESICHFNDHGDGIVGVAVRAQSVSSVSFSIDEKKLLSVSNDGVVVVRNLNIENEFDRSLEVAEQIKEVSKDEYIDEFGALYNRDQTILLKGPKNVSEYIIKNGTRIINDHAFEGCAGLLKIHIPNTVEIIEYAAFYNCRRLESIDIPESVTSIGSEVFYYCKSLTNITIPKSVKDIGMKLINIGNRFISIVNLSPNFEVENNIIYTAEKQKIISYLSKDNTFVVPDSVITIGDSAFWTSSLKNITIPNTVTSIGSWAFYCSSLISIDIPDSVITLGGNAFKYNSSLRKVKISKSMSIIENSTFVGCRSLERIEIPQNIDVLEDFSFEGCVSLTKITILNPHIHIGNKVFDSCKSLKSILIPLGTKEKMMENFPKRLHEFLQEGDDLPF